MFPPQLTGLTPLPAFTDNYIWAMSLADSAVVVDPGDAQVVLSWLERTGLSLAGILITHHHADHTGGLAGLLERHDCPVFGPASGRIPGISHPVRAGETIRVPALQLALDVLEVPGHTLDHIALAGRWQDTSLVFCGDTLFSAGCGRLFEGTPAQMWNSLGALAGLPAETLICCTHEYTLANLAFAVAAEPGNTVLKQHLHRCQQLRAQDRPTLPSTLELERQINPFLRAMLPELGHHIPGWEQDANSITSSVDRFAALRRWKDVFRA